MNSNLSLYKNLLGDIKSRVRQGQLRANLSANAEMLATYWDIGKMIYQRQQQEGWGKGVVPRLAKDLKNELAEIKGFSERNLKFMIQFFREYSELISIGKRTVSQFDDGDEVKEKLSVSQFTENRKSITTQPISKLQEFDIQDKLILATGWAHHIILIQRIKDLPIRYWYMQQILANGWSRDMLIDMIKSNLHKRQGNAITNFDRTLPAPQSELAKQMLKDPYIFDFMTLATPFSERELELELISVHP